MRTRLMLLGLSILAHPTLAAADTPAVIPVQGFLADAVGQPVDGVHRLTFILYDAENGRDPLYTDDWRSVAVDGGHFVVYLGSQDGSPLDLALFRERSEVWLEVIVDGEEIIEPRTRLASVPYAAHANTCVDAAHAAEADNAATLGGSRPAAFALADHTHPWSELTPTNGPLTLGDLTVTEVLSTGCELVTCSGGDWLECDCPEGKYLQTGGCDAGGTPNIVQASHPVSLTRWRCGGHGGGKRIDMICCRQR
jgi:hypothetical protein